MRLLCRSPVCVTPPIRWQTWYILRVHITSITAPFYPNLHDYSLAVGNLKVAINPDAGLQAWQARTIAYGLGLPSDSSRQATKVFTALVDLFLTKDASIVEVNPLVTTTDGRVLAADCRVTIDDYAVFRHPELGIRIARELDHPPTRLEEIAYDLEQRDHRGTFYFAVLPRTGEAGEKVIGFHGAGGGGSMMSMDAVSQAGFTPANFTDTSGNPSAAKVYAAARIILSQPGLVGYFGSGSGVASQEQYWSAYGLAKAFNELHLSVPALIRLGGNSEDRAVEILEDACKDLPATVEGYKKDDPPRAIGERFTQLVDDAAGSVWEPTDRIVPAFVEGDGVKLCDVSMGDGWTGGVWLDAANLDDVQTQTVLKLAGDLLRVQDERLTLAITPEDAAKRDSDWIALGAIEDDAEYIARFGELFGVDIST